MLNAMCYRATYATVAAAAAAGSSEQLMDGWMYWTKYAFMFPVSVGVATVAMLTGVGSAALFSPIFLLGFPLLGPEYHLETAGLELALTAHSVKTTVVTAVRSTCE
jgi:hypothetical protein